MYKDIIRKIWQEELGLSDLSDKEDFFDLGGHSLIMARVQIQIKEKIGFEMPMDDLFRYSSIEKISAFILAKEGMEENCSAGLFHSKNALVS